MDREGAMTDEKVVGRLMAAKKASGKCYSQIAAETGLTNVYVAQLLRRQAQLKPATALALRAAIPSLTDDLVSEMMNPPFRSYHPNLIQEPAVYRLNEAVMHFGESIKEIINEDFGDGILQWLCHLGWVDEDSILSFSLRISSTGGSSFDYVSSMSAIDFHCSVDKVQGVDGKDRVVITFDGKYLPYSEQRSEHMVSRLRR